MTARVLEAVPNFSEGRELGVVRAIVAAIAGAGADVLDWSADADHHRSVVTFVGTPEVVERAALAGARVAVERIDLRQHSGVHPRVGALDVLPFVPLVGLSMDDARASAQRVGRRLANELGIPVFFYSRASDPPGRTLAELRRGGFEALVDGWPADRRPDLQPSPWPHAGAHPTAGATCVGARPLLLAWNVLLEDVGLDAATEIASRLRESGGGFRGLRALALQLPRRGALQISMNLEDLEATRPSAVFARLEELVAARGGRVVQTEIIGMIPDELLLTLAADRLRLVGAAPERLLSRRVLEYLAGKRSTQAKGDG
ncbi:MAG: glutamate formimidoyltransferase [Gemmatimonadetes bacterium]|nr:glutamate formimidoyltransferase [Gemmatimonadota bacterium]